MDYFDHIPAWRVIVCKACRHAVWPGEVQGHLQGKQHRISKKDAIQIAEEVEQWPGIVQYPTEFEVPVYIDKPVPELPLYEDGFKCELAPAQCSHICRGQASMRVH